MYHSNRDYPSTLATRGSSWCGGTGGASIYVTGGLGGGLICIIADKLVGRSDLLLLMEVME